MASRQIFDPIALIRASPLVTSSFALWCCVDQWLYYTNFIKPENRAKSNEFLPQWWRTHFNSSVLHIVGLYSASAAGGFVNPAVGTLVAGAKGWYVAGAVLSLSHFLFVPAVAYKLKAMMDDEPRGNVCAMQQRWLSVHVFRSVTVDLAAWACYLVAVCKGLSVAAA